MNNLRILFSVLWCTALGISSQASADDIDVARAQAAYDQARAEANEGERIYRDAQRRLQPLEQRVREAEAREQQADVNVRIHRNELARLDREVAQIIREIDQLERDHRALDSSRQQREQEKFQLETRSRELQRELSRLQTEEQRIQQRIQQLEQNDPESPRLPQLRSQLHAVRLDIRTVQSNQQNTATRLRQVENELRQISQDMTRNRQNHQNAQRNQRRLEASRDDAARNLNRAENELWLAQRESSNARNALALERPHYDSAYRQWQQLEARANQAYSYLQQVIRNYNRAREEVARHATAEGARHASREAEDRVLSPAQRAGIADGRADGSRFGERDGRATASVQGYLSARNSPTAEPQWVSHYEAGIERGQQIAQQKAQSENLPQGFNDAKDARIRETPVSEDRIDITTALPELPPGGGDLDLTHKELTVRPVPSPHYQAPQEPGPWAPDTQRPEFSVPSPDNRYYAANCTGQRRPEFEQVCRDAYAEGYASGFHRAYRDRYVQIYNAQYSETATAAYRQAKEADYPDSFIEGGTSGAQHAGVLESFAASLPGAQQQAYRDGQQQFNDELARGYLVRVNAARITTSSPFGTFSKADSVQLEIVVDNFGLEAVPLEAVKFELSGSLGIQELTFEQRNLPPLAPNTRTTLVGVTSGSIVSEIAGSDLRLSGRVSVNQQSLSTHDATAKVSFPIELAILDVDGKPRVNQWADAQISIKQNAEIATPSGRLRIGANPMIIDFDPEYIDLTELEPGEERLFDVRIKPGVWVGQNTQVPYIAQFEPEGEYDVQARQLFPQYLEVTRTAAIDVFDGSGRRIPNATLPVRAGGSVNLLMNINYLASQRRPGPFVLSYVRASHPEIRLTSGSTTRINYGAYGPGSSSRPSRIGFVVPQSLRNERVWVMLQLTEGNQTLHVQQVFLDVQ